MANIKISELNELITGERAYDDYLPIVDSSANETKKVSVKNLIPNNVELIAVTDTAPTSFGTGDKYYNTTTNRIYTARSGEWISPEEPIKGILYVILEDQKTFTYDEYNETLVSVGGGGGGGIAVYPDEPEEDTKLYIEEEDLDFQGLPISSEKTTGDNVAYSADYSNSAFGGTILWTNPDPTSGFASQNITLSSDDYDVLKIFYKATKSGIEVFSQETLKEYSGSLFQVWGGGNTTNSRVRAFTYSNATTYNISAGYQVSGGSGSQNNDIIIPLYVIGYKTGLFN